MSGPDIGGVRQPLSCSSKDAWSKACAEYERVVALLDPEHPRYLQQLDTTRRMAFAYAHTLDVEPYLRSTGRLPKQSRKEGR